MDRTEPRGIDCHAHIIDPARYPLPPGRGYKPRPDEQGSAEQFSAVLDRHGIHHGVLVQLTGYGTDNAPLVETMRAMPGRFKAIAQVAPEIGDRALEDLARVGVVGVRFNLPSYDPDALTRPDAPRLLARLKALGLFAQVYADDRQWQLAAPVLQASGIRVLVDHFGVVDMSGGIGQKGFQAVLDLGRRGQAVAKLSSLFRVSRRWGDYADLDPFVEQLLAAFGRDNCVWGSDWPFINVPRRPVYAELLAPLRRWFPDDGDRVCVLARNPARLFGFKE